MSQKKNVCAHASKAKGKAKRRINKTVLVSDLDTESILIGKIVNNKSGTQYQVENIIDKSLCHCHARNGVRAFRTPNATLVAYAINSSKYNIKDGTKKNTGEIVKIISENEYDELCNYFTYITLDMIFFSLNKINTKSVFSSNDKSLYANTNINNEVNLPSVDENINNSLNSEEEPITENYSGGDEKEQEYSESSESEIDQKEKIRLEIESARKKKKQDKLARVQLRANKMNKENDVYIPSIIDTYNADNDQADINIDDI